MNCDCLTVTVVVPPPIEITVEDTTIAVSCPATIPGPPGPPGTFVSPPSSSTSPGTFGQQATDGLNLYVCYATNKWAQIPMYTIWP
jgi:hypothetical protein